MEDLPVERKYSFKSGVNIMFGCSGFLQLLYRTVCAPEGSAAGAEEIIREIEQLVADSVIEVMLLRDRMSIPDKNLKEPVTFAQLLEEVERLRVGRVSVL